MLPGTVVALVIWRDEIRGLPGALGHRSCAGGSLLAIRPGIRPPGAALPGALLLVRSARRFRHRRFRPSCAALRASHLWHAAAHDRMVCVAVLAPVLASRPSGLPLHRKGGSLFAAVLFGLVAVRQPPVYRSCGTRRDTSDLCVAAGCLLIIESDLDSRKRQLIFLAVVWRRL